MSKIIESPVDKSLVILLGTHGVNWITEDCGLSIKALNAGRKIKEFVFHPFERNWALASAFTLCEDFKGEPCKIYKELYLTKDLGKNWEILASYIVQFGWGVYNKETEKQGIPKERILVTLEQKGKGNQQHVGWNYKIDFIYSDDFLKTKKIGAHKGNKFMVTKDYLFIAQVVDQETQEVLLLSSYLNETNYDFKTIETDSKLYKEHSYTFLDSNDGTVFLHVNHFGTSSKYGHVYLNGEDFSKYSLSLKYNLRNSNNQCDFEKLQSLEGLYIANALSLSYMEESQQELEQEEYEAETGIQQKEIQKQDENEETYLDFIKTLISFNKGGQWLRLKAPSNDLNGLKYDCGDYCFLNLHGLHSEFPPFYSVPSAYGIIIANGNVGRYLSHAYEDTSTFLSRDGGLNWFEIRKGSHIYEIGDHGGLIIIADDQNPTNSIFYSYDEGLNFEELKISSFKLQVKNIIIEPSSTSQNFIIYGEALRKGEKKGVIIGLDFSKLHKPVCLYPESPDSSQSDYEKWSPSDGKHSCLLGRKYIITRRKRDVKCYNPLELEKKVLIENCECTEADYECDVGYERQTYEGPCVLTDNSKEKEVIKPPENCNGYFAVTKGYRKIFGDTCVNGLKFDPLLLPCPNQGIFSSLGVLFTALIIVIVILLLIVFFNKSFFQNVSDIVKERMDNYKTNNNNNNNDKQMKYTNIVNNCLILG